MKAPLVSLPLLLFLTTSAFAGCRLDSKDFAALRLSPSHLQNQQAVNRLSQDKQTNICVTRTFVRELRQNPSQFMDKKIPDFWPFYLSPDEKTFVVAWEKKELSRRIKGGL
jgi:hypothetical protein